MGNFLSFYGKKVGGIGEDYKILATSSVNVTYATQLGELKTVFDTLSDEDKKRCVVERAGSIFHIQDITSGRFGMTTYSATNYQYFEMRLSDSTYKQIVVATSFSVNDISSSTDTVPLYLIRL